MIFSWRVLVGKFVDVEFFVARFSSMAYAFDSICICTFFNLLHVLSSCQMNLLFRGSGDCGNPYLPDLNQRTSFQAEWILSVACAESVDPPDYWDCPGVPKPPTERPLPEPTPRPTVPPTPRPTVSPTPRPTVSPTPRPTTARATPRPTPQRTMGGRTTPAPVQPGDNPTAPDTTPPPANGAPVGLPQPNRPPTAILVDNTLDPTMRPTLESSSDGSGPAPAPAGDPTDAPIVQRIPVNIVIDFDENPQVRKPCAVHYFRHLCIRLILSDMLLCVLLPTN